MSYAAYPYVARGPNGRWRYLSGLGALGASPTVTTVRIVLTGTGDEGTRIVQTQLQRLNFLAPGTGPTGADGKWGSRTELALQNAARYVGYTDGPAFTKSGTTVTIPTALLGLIQAATPAAQGTPGAISSSSSTTTDTTTLINTTTPTSIGPAVDQAQASASSSSSAAGPLIALGAGVLLVAGLVFWGAHKSNIQEPKSTKYAARRSSPLFALRVKRVKRNARKRKTRDVYDIQGDYGQGFETVTAETTWTDARRAIREYRDNEPGVAFRIKTTREKI